MPVPGSKPVLFAIAALGLAVLLSGCVQLGTGQTGTGQGGAGAAVLYVCPDGTTTVADINQCPEVPGVQAQVLTPAQKDAAVCSGMPQYQGAYLEDTCILGVAGKYRDVSLCAELARDQRISCYVLVAELTTNPDLCGQSDMSNQCYEQYAREKGDETVCEKITEVGYKDSCYSSVATKMADGSICGSIRTAGQKNSCYFSIAMNTRDSALCNNITEASQKDNCLQNIGGGGGASLPPMQQQPK